MLKFLFERMTSSIKVTLGILLTAVLIGYVRYKMNPKLPFHMEGGADPEFANVGRAFRTVIENGMMGGAFAVYYKGKLVADVWGGYSNAEEKIKWKENTVQMVMSTTKGVCSICLALLAEQGHMSYDDIVMEHWPDFAQNGKEDVTIRQLLGHEAGLVTVDELIRLEDLINNPERVGKILARQMPQWPPGSAHGYHMVTFGLYADQLIRHVDPKQRGLQQFFNEEIAKPYGIDFTIGLTEEFEDRLALSIEPGLAEYWDTIMTGSWRIGWFFVKAMFQEGTLASRAINVTTPALFTPGWTRRRERFRPAIGSSHGFGTARSLARIYSLLNTPSSDTPRLVSEKVSSEFLRVKAGLFSEDLLTGSNNSFTVGFNHMLNPEGNVVYGHPGFGGQYAFADPRHDLTWAMVTNHLKIVNPQRDIRYKTLLDAVYESINAIEAKTKPKET